MTDSMEIGERVRMVEIKLSGERAAKRGAPRNANPYLVGTPSHEAWADGWSSHEQERKRAMTWNVGDWVVYDRRVGQIKKMEDGFETFSDGHIEISGRLSGGFRPLTLRNKRIAETFDIYYTRLRNINGEAGFNYPDIAHHFSKLALDAIDHEGSEEPFKQAQQFIIQARNYTPEIQGINLFRPNPSRAHGQT